MTVDKAEPMFAVFTKLLPTNAENPIYWPRAQRAITRSCCWHCLYGLGASHVSVCLALPSAVYLVQPRGIGVALWQLSLKMRRFGEKSQKRNSIPGGPVGDAVKEDRAGDLGHPAALISCESGFYELDQGCTR